MIRDASGLRGSYNRKSFFFEHSVGSLFDVDHLAELVCREPELTRTAYCSCTSASVSDGWAAGSPSYRAVHDAIQGVADNNSLILLRHLERSTNVGPILQELIDEVVSAVGPELQTDMLGSRATVLIASPRRITSYHIDSDSNFLLQIHGDKSLSVFDPGDRTLITPEELEAFYCGDVNAAKYKPERQPEACVYELHAGSAVHIPTHAPHWAQNRDSVSVALSINFDLRSVQRIGRIYRLNGRLRRFGISPQEPGSAPWMDDIKLGMSVLNRRVSRWVHPSQDSAEHERRYD